MGLSCFVIVAAIAASLPAGPPNGAQAGRAAMTSVAPARTARAVIARATIEPPPMAQGRRSAHRSVRRLVAAE